MTVAALYIDPLGPYPKLAAKLDATAQATCDLAAIMSPPLDCWDASRDARLYDGPHPVVAHPPCTHYGRLRHLGKADDADCAPRAVEQVRKWGGVLEHPAGSKLWELSCLPFPTRCAACDLPRHWCLCAPIPCDAFGGYTIELDQVEWGHVAQKRTWLYLAGVPREALESAPFRGRKPTHHVSRDAKRAHRNGYTLKRTSSAQNGRTPPLFAEYLVRLASKAVRP